MLLQQRKNVLLNPLPTYIGPWLTLYRRLCAIDGVRQKENDECLSIHQYKLITSQQNILHSAANLSLFEDQLLLEMESLLDCCWRPKANTAKLNIFAVTKGTVNYGNILLHDLIVFIKNTTELPTLFPNNKFYNSLAKLSNIKSQLLSFDLKNRAYQDKIEWSGFDPWAAGWQEQTNPLRYGSPNDGIFLTYTQVQNLKLQTHLVYQIMHNIKQWPNS